MFVLSADSSARVSLSTSSLNDYKEVFVAFSPGFDYFAVRGFSVGLDLTLSYDFTRGYGFDGRLTDTTTTTIGAGPRFGLNLPIGDAVSFYPRVTLGIESLYEQESDALAPLPGSGPAVGSSSSFSAAYVVVFTPLLYHPAPHFFIGAGPGVFTELGSMGTAASSVGGERTNVFARLTMGAWWGGAREQEHTTAEPADEPPSPAPISRIRRFGDAGTAVLTGELGAGVSHTTYADVDFTVMSYILKPGLDYFVADHFSFGVAAGVGQSTVDATSPTGAKGEAATTALAAAARLGVDLPLASSLSLYPRASFEVARSWESANFPTRKVDSASNAVTVALYVPLLVHVAPHAFAGFGPYVGRDLVNRAENARDDNLRTTVGAQLVVGGWLSR